MRKKKLRSKHFWHQKIKQWQTVAWEIRKVRKDYGKDTELGARRTLFEKAVEVDDSAIYEAMIEKEPITIVLSQKGWIRALKGHMSDYTSLSFKDGDKAETWL